MKAFVSNFIRNKGIWVGSSLLVSRLSTFLLAVFAARLLSVSEFGLASTALNFISFFVVFAGFGAQNGMLKYGVQLKDEQKEDFYKYSFSYGMLGNIIVSLFILVLAYVIYGQGRSLLLIILILVIRFFGNYMIEQKLAESRTDFNNKRFAQISIYTSLFTFFITLFSTYFYGLQGYILGISVSPLFILFFYKWNMSFAPINFTQFSTRDFWRFSIATGVAAQISSWVLILDVFFIALLLSNDAVAEYRVSCLIPSNLIVIGTIILQTEYPKLCQKWNDKVFQKNFIISYLKMMTLISAVLLLIGFTFSLEILQMFGKQYSNTLIFQISLVSTVIMLLFRVPFIYLIYALGKTKLNLILALISVVVLSGFYFVIPLYGLVGVAYYHLFSFTLISFLYVISYFSALRKI